MKEWNIQGANEGVVKMIRQLETNLKSPLLTLASVRVVIDDEHHNEQAWAKTLEFVLTFFVWSRLEIEDSISPVLELKDEIGNAGQGQTRGLILHSELRNLVVIDGFVV